MKISKQKLKQIILEEMGDLLEQEQDAETPAPSDARQDKVVSATTSGAMLSTEEYTQMLKQVLLSDKVSPQARKQALEGIFADKGAAINSLVLQMLKGAQK